MAYTHLLNSSRSGHGQLSGKVVYVIVTLALAAVIALTVLSWMKLCSQSCAEGHQYRLYGFKFETVGLVIFPTMLLFHLVSPWLRILATATGWMLCASLGAEIVFIYAQKYMIGSWCPVCLSIAAALVCASGAYFYEYCNRFEESFEHEDKGQIMHHIYKGLSGIIILVAGFLFAFGGIGKYHPLQAAENEIKEKLAFGKLNSPVEVYVFTDWACPGCRKLEPMLEAALPDIMKQARVIFVDNPVHPETLNYSPYNLSFMIHNKPKYMKLRGALTDLSEETKTPSDEQVAALAQRLGASYKQLSYSEIALASKYFNYLVEKLEVEGTPTVVIVSKAQKKGKKLSGTGEINEAAIQKAIQAYNK